MIIYFNNSGLVYAERGELTEGGGRRPDPDSQIRLLRVEALGALRYSLRQPFKQRSLFDRDGDLTHNLERFRPVGMGGI